MNAIFFPSGAKRGVLSVLSPEINGLGEPLPSAATA